MATPPVPTEKRAKTGDKAVRQTAERGAVAAGDTHPAVSDARDGFRVLAVGVVLRVQIATRPKPCAHPERGYEVSREILVEAVAVVGLVAVPRARRLVAQLRPPYVAR